MKKCLAGFRITSQFLSAPSRRWAKRRSVFQLRVSDYMLDIVSLHHRLQPAWQTLRLSKRSSSVLMKISRQCSSDMLSCTGTRVKAWTRWSSPKQKATHKILCMYILNLLPSDVAHVYLSFSAEYQQVYNFLYEEHTYANTLTAISIKKQLWTTSTKKNTRKKLRKTWVKRKKRRNNESGRLHRISFSHNYSNLYNTVMHL